MTRKRIFKGKKAGATKVKEETTEVTGEVETPDVKDEPASSEVDEVDDNPSSQDGNQEETEKDSEDGNVVIELQLTDAKDSGENSQEETVDEDDNGMVLQSHGGDMEEMGDEGQEEDMGDDNEEDAGNMENEEENFEEGDEANVDMEEGNEANAEIDISAEEKQLLEDENETKSSAADVPEGKVTPDTKKQPVVEESSTTEAEASTKDDNKGAAGDKEKEAEDKEKVDNKTESKEATLEEEEKTIEEENADHNEENKDYSCILPSDKEFISEKFKLPPFPESLSKLTKLTVTIGPIQQVDLYSNELHRIFNLIMDFEIKFEGKEKKSNSGRVFNEKMGYVRTQFKIRTPSYLVKMATLLGNLNIRGRDMSVKFPEVFNMAVKDCKEYEAKNKGAYARLMKEKQAYIMDLRKRRILVKNIPENTTEDTMKALFPECQTVDFREEDIGNKKLCSAILTFENEKVCNECFESNKDVEIGDSKVQIKKFYEPSNFRRPFNQSRWGARGGRGGVAFRGGMSSFRGGRSPNRGGATMFNKKPNMGNRPSSVPSSTPVNKFSSPVNKFSSPPPGKGKFVSKVSPQRNSSGSNQQRRRSDSGPQSRPNQSRPINDKRSFGSSTNRTPEFKGQFGAGFKQNKFNNRKGMNTGQFSQGGFQSGNMRTNQFSQGGQDRNLQMQGGSRSTEEDPMAMMAYLKNTIAKMEQKMTQQDSYGGGNSGSSNFNSRKRQGGMMDQHTNAKRQNFQKRTNKNQGFQGVQQSYGSSSSYQDPTRFTGTNFGGSYTTSTGYSMAQNYGNNSSMGMGNQGNQGNYTGNQQYNSGRYGGGNW